MPPRRLPAALFGGDGVRYVNSPNRPSLGTSPINTHALQTSTARAAVRVELASVPVGLIYIWKKLSRLLIVGVPRRNATHAHAIDGPYLF